MRMWDFFVILHPYYCTKENVMRAAGKPVSAGEVAKSLNADRKEVDKAFAGIVTDGKAVNSAEK